MRHLLILLFFAPAVLQAQNVGININLPVFKLDIRSLNDVTDAPDLQLATPSQNHFLRLFGGRDGDPKPFLLFNTLDTFRIATSAPDFANFKENMTFFGDGRVGINNPLPVRMLHLVGDGLFSGGGQIFTASDSAALTIVDENLYQLSFDGNDIQGWDPLFNSTTTMFIQRVGGDLDLGDSDFFLDNATGDITMAANLTIGALAGVGDRNVMVGPSGDLKIGVGGGADTDWTETPSAVYNTTHNIGIGTSTPLARLHINGLENDLLNASLMIFTPGFTSLLDNTMFIDGNEIDVTGPSNEMHLQGESDGGITMVQGGGNVGVGQQDPPLRKLAVTGESIPIAGDLSTSLATFSLFNLEPVFSEMVFDANEIQTVDETFFLNSKSSHDIRMVDGGGSVGIGTQPNSRLTIEGNDNDGTIAGLEIRSAGNGQIMLLDGNEIDATGSATTLVLNNNSGGPVTIGTLTPATGYKLSVNGGIMAEEVRVQLSAAWPDYVFKDDYQLMDLASLEQAIEEHSHLPGIPSADVIAKDGLLLGDMQRLMVEKIEELTLYIIDLNKRIEALENENRSLKAK